MDVGSLVGAPLAGEVQHNLHCLLGICGEE